MTSSRAVVLGCPIDRLDMEETVDRCREIIESRRSAQQVSVNAAKLVALRDDPHLREIVTGCDLINADGQAVVWASRVLGDPLPARVPGIDLMERLCEMAARRGYGVFILGAREEILEQALGVLRHQYPGLIVDGHHGYFSEDESQSVADEIVSARPHILFLAISSPRKEYWLATHGRALGIPLSMGVGGSVDVVAGVTRRAPAAVQRLGLEWAFRLAQEPRRLIRRYAVTNSRFLWLVTVEVLRRARSLTRVGRG